MATETIRIDIIKEGMRTFVIPTAEDIDYDEKIMKNRKRELEKKIAKLQAEIAEQKLSVDRLEDGKAKNKALSEIELNEDEVFKLTSSCEQIDVLLQNYEAVRETRKTLLANATSIELEFHEPLWDDITQMEDRFRTLIEKTGQYVTDRVAVQYALLRKCCPQALKQSPAVADRVLSLIRRYTEVNTADLPFLF